MSPAEFADLEERVLTLIPSDGKINLAAVVLEVSKDDDSGYGRSNAKSALLGLKAEGRIEIDHTGGVWRV